MNRDAAIEAGAQALDPTAWDDLAFIGPTYHALDEQEEAQDEARRKAAAVIDAAAPHLTPAVQAQALQDAADEIQALHPGEVKASVEWLRSRADCIRSAAALPHLVGEPVEWIVVNHYGAPAYSGIKDQKEALDRARRWNEGRPADSHYRVVALVPVDQP